MTHQRESAFKKTFKKGIHSEKNSLEKINIPQSSFRPGLQINKMEIKLMAFIYTLERRRTRCLQIKHPALFIPVLYCCRCSFNFLFVESNHL